uniref:SRPBCC domain-containing protein n=1 Tax=uncultured Draconibacterium sp. TaxID=1573823 RepID=UPI00321727A8
MKKEITTTIQINASSEIIWKILTDFEKYPEWNSFVKSVTGEVKAGNKIKVKIEPPEEKGMSFKPKIMTCEANKELSWIGHFLLPGIFDGEHKFELTDNGNGTTTFKQSEKFKGILVGILNIENTKKGFEAMNKKLKELAEQY